MTPDIPCLCGHDARSCPHRPWQHTPLAGHTNIVTPIPADEPLIPWEQYRLTIGLTVSRHTTHVEPDSRDEAA